MTPSDFQPWLRNPTRRCLTMGVLNVTPDSFSDGGQYAAVEAAAAHALQMAAEGADIIDIGGESTRPGAARISPQEQIGRILPVLDAIRGKTDALISVDTTRAEVAEAALAHGAHVLNDISAGTDDPAMLPLAARSAAPTILMHMRGQPATMQADPAYTDVTREVAGYLLARASAARQAGVAASNILIDPGIGFGKTADHNLQLLRDLPALTSLGYPLVIGTSRKSFIGKITQETDPAHRLWGGAAAVAWSVANGSAIVRVHDVEPMAKVVRMIEAIKRGKVAALGA